MINDQIGREFVLARLAVLLAVLAVRQRRSLFGGAIEAIDSATKDGMIGCKNKSVRYRNEFDF
jgi:hypothetical protein